MKMLLFFDTETQGLPMSWNEPANMVSNWPRVTQLAWELCYEDGETIEKESFLIRPDGWTIPKTEFFELQGMSTERSLDEGISMKDIALPYFINALEEADLLIAHNIAFDVPIITAEMFRYGQRPLRKTEKFCTKEAMTNVCKIPGFNPSKYKWPTLEEAYNHYYGKMPEGAHQADFDVWACKEVYLALKSGKQKFKQ